MADITEPKSNKELTDDEAALRELRTESEYLEKYGFHFPDDHYTFKARPGLDAEIVAEISHIKGEPGWMTDYRLRAYEIFQSKPMPNWGGDLSKIKFDEIFTTTPKPPTRMLPTGMRFPTILRKPLIAWASRRRRRQFLAGARARSTRAKSSTTTFRSTWPNRA